ncbi:MAG: SDR family oxidoreductase [Burkholderiales bacterium]|nr:MAG: SDR family oxidoreductase [Burkholderiales bacterium]
MHLSLQLAGQTALVTGGASGIGLACAQQLAEAGAHVVVADNNYPRAQEVAATLRGDALAIDVGDEASVQAAALDMRDRFGALDILVNSAGVLQRTLPPEKLLLKEWDFVARIDLRGTYLCCALFGSDMAAKGRGAIVNIASIAGMSSGPLHSYGPAKAGVISLTQSLAGEWGPRSVRVNCISPGFTQTPALGKGFSTATLSEEDLVRSSALGRLVRADEVARTAVFLASDWASAITGVNIPVDAGFLVATPWSAYGGLRSTLP